MPELPEVEAARRGIADQLIGRPITGVDLRLPKLIVATEALSVDALRGHAIEDVRRHGKYLTLVFGDVSGVVHLKLSGQLVGRGDTIAGFGAGHPVPAYDAVLPHKSTHLILDFDGARLFLTDIRHFARVYLMPTDDLPSYFDKVGLGPDAVAPDFTLDVFLRRLQRRRLARLKPLLLDQSFIAGLGNIYVDEALHRAGLHPERLASSLTDDEVARLYQAIVDTLTIAVPIGGASILNGKATPVHGEFPFIHGRRGEACLNCGQEVVKVRVNNRGTYLCPNCQQSSVASIAAAGDDSSD